MSTESRDVTMIAEVGQRLIALPYEVWSFGDSVAFEALVEATEATGDPRYLEFAHGLMRGWAARRDPMVELDATAPGFAMVQVAAKTGDALLTEALVDLATYLRQRPLLDGIYQTWASSPLRQPYGPLPLSAHGAALLVDPPPGVFIDCLHFDPPFFTSLGRLVGDAELVADGASQALAYCRVLQEDDGLFDHFALKGETETFGPAWGRGQGWALLGLLDVIEHLDSDLSSVELGELAEPAIALINRMVELQDDDGNWPSVVTRPDSVPEASTAAFMGRGFLRAYRLGLGDERVRAAGLKAVDAAVTAAARGYLYPVSAAVWACTQAEHYCHVPTGFVVPWGEGPLLLALAERMRLESGPQ